MSSNEEIFTALNSVDEAVRTLATRPFDQLRPVDRRAILLRLEGAAKKLALVQRRELQAQVARTTPVEFGGAPWAEVLARRLRISVGEAQRRIADAASADEPRSA